MNRQFGKAGFALALGLITLTPNLAQAHIAQACWNFVQKNCIKSDHSMDYCTHQSDTICNHHDHDDQQPQIGAYANPSATKPAQTLKLFRKR